MSDSIYSLMVTLSKDQLSDLMYALDLLRKAADDEKEKARAEELIGVITNALVLI